MGAQTAITAEQYLRTAFPDLDKEYRDGDIVERSLPDRLHSATQGLLAAFFVALRKALPVFVYPELRIRLRTGLYRIPDVSVYYPVKPTIDIPDTPPYVAIEILSPDDRMSEVREKLEEYRVFGVTHIWLLDPHSRRMYTCNPVFTEVATLQLPEFQLELGAADVFE